MPCNHSKRWPRGPSAFQCFSPDECIWALQIWRSWDDKFGYIEHHWTKPESNMDMTTNWILKFIQGSLELIPNLYHLVALGGKILWNRCCKFRWPEKLIWVGMSSKIVCKSERTSIILRRMDQSKTALGRRMQLQRTPTQSLEPRNNLAFAFFSLSPVSRILPVSWVHTCRDQLEG